MRNVTKAMTSYTWAMSLFWTQQVSDLVGLGGTAGWDRSAQAITNVTDATVAEMTDSMRAVFASGDRLQRSLVDLVLSPLAVPLNAATLRAAGWCAGAGGDADGMPPIADAAARPTRRTADAAGPRAARHRADPASSPDDAAYGWGPMAR